MIAALQLWVAPLAALGFTLWAALMALAAEGDPQLPRVMAVQLPVELDGLSVPRSLYVTHIALLVLAGASSALAVSWWSWPPVEALGRLMVVVTLVWVLGDLLPRLVPSIAPEWVAPARATAVRTIALFRPLVQLVSWADRGRIRPRRMSEPLAAAAHRGMVHGVFSLDDMTVAEVMTPRLDIVAVDVSATREEVFAILRSSEHARVLVIDGDPDSVVGIIYAKDMLEGLTAEEGAGDWHALIRPASFVPEAKTLDRQLRDFQRGPSHIAVVVDEFGGTSGIMTLEDILEQIVGEIQDEYDTEEVVPLQKVAERRWTVQGGVPLSELEAALETSFGREDVNTVGGLVLAELGHVPRPGEAFDLMGHRFEVEQVVRRRVRRVAVEAVPAVEPDEAGVEAES